jgi:hypothetical protein
MAQEFVSGDIVPQSGIYRISHDPAHMPVKEVTALKGTRFPNCNHCKHMRFELVHGAPYIEEIEKMGSGHAAVAEG